MLLLFFLFFSLYLVFFFFVERGRGGEGESKPAYEFITHKFLNMFNYIFFLYLLISGNSFSYDRGMDSAADITIADMLGRNIVAPICRGLDVNDPSLTTLE